MAQQATAWKIHDTYRTNGTALALSSVRCEVRERSVKFEERHNAFGFSLTVPRDEVRFNREDAITQFVVGRLDQIDRLRARIALAEAEIDAARSLTVEEPVAVVKHEK